jgi:hypothetical protein
MSRRRLLGRRAPLVALLWALLLPAIAEASPPALGPLSAANLQGTSALLKATVDPEGLATSYWFEYAQAPSFAAAAKTPPATAGSGTDPHPARAQLRGLTPSTTYHYRLVAQNSSGTSTSSPASFTTTKGFGLLPGQEGFAASVFADGGSAASQAASHPYALELSAGFNIGGEFEGQPGVAFPDGDLRNLRIELPPGLLLNPNVLEECSAAQFNAPRLSPFEAGRSGESCPDRSQVGTLELKTSLDGGQTRRFGLFNLAPPSGVAGQLGAAPFGQPVVFDIALRANSDGSYVLALQAENFPQSLDVSALELALWGTPWGASHDGERGICLNEVEPAFPWAKCTAGEPATFPPRSFLTMPVTCSPELAFLLTASSWQQPAQQSRTAQNMTSGGQVAALSACESVVFDPAPLGFLTTTKASSGSGYNFRLTNNAEGLTKPLLRAAALPRSMRVILPEGTTINPSVGAGLGSCSPDEYATETAFSAQGAACPNASKIGEFRVRSPLFDEWMEGAIYLATPNDPTTGSPGAENPFDSLIAIYLVAKQPQRGVMVKLAGKITADPRTGSLAASFEGLPQLPYTDLEMNIRAGQRAVLVSPPGCGTANTAIEMSAWSNGQKLTRLSASQIASGIDGGPCPPPGAPPFSPDAVTGAVNSNVGSYTPYFVKLSRRDTEQEITSYSLELPKGVTGKLAGIPFCPEAAIAVARTKRGQAEIASPSCPAASQVGRTITGYGVGPALTFTPGRIYLAGPYQGRPLSLVTINAATVGPFDLGTIVIRSAFAIDERTAQLEIDSRASDPIPHIIEGIPVHLREIRVFMDRSEFTHNPSSCEPAQLISTLTGSGARFDDPSDDSVATVTRHFQLLNCLTLDFRPKLGMRLRGGSRRGAYPQLRATFAARGPQDSNLKRIEVNMPRSLFLAQNHIRTICTRVQFAQERCPEGSIYGRAVAYTPLLDEPLRGEVYLRSSSNPLPDLVASLRSGAIRIAVEGKISGGKRGIRAFFDNLPDAPIDRFVMTLHGGKRGLLVNSVNICRQPPLATISALGQNNIGAQFSSVLRGQCKGAKKRKGKRAALSSALRRER